MDPHRQRCRRCRTTRAYVVVGPGPCRDMTVLRCSHCGVVYGRKLSHAARGGLTYCGMEIGARVQVWSGGSDSCLVCDAAQRAYQPVELPRMQADCKDCQRLTEHGRHLFLEPRGREVHVARCGCGRERRERDLVHQSAHGATACGLPLDAAVRSSSADPLAVTCEACRAAREEPDAPEVLEAEMACSRCGSAQPQRTRVRTQGQREVVDRSCARCGAEARSLVLNHLPGKAGQTRCGLSAKHRFIHLRKPLSTCRACALEALVEAMGSAPDWRPDVPVAEDYFAA